MVDVSRDEFSYRSIDTLVAACIEYYKNRIRRFGTAKALERRVQLSKWIEKFHRDCGTFDHCVQEALESLHKDNCLLLMTGHQPNLFAYGGVLKKATLNHILAEKIRKSLDVPVVCFFGLADQDFASDRWVKSALLPDVEKRNGVLELNANLPPTMMLNKIKKLPKNTLVEWHDSIIDWIERNASSANRFLMIQKLTPTMDKELLKQRFESFWRVVEKTHANAAVYSDFGGFLISEIVNGIWGYDTVFSRFSECQQIFQTETETFLKRFEEYSSSLKNVLGLFKDGAFQEESATLPFWYHCDCGSKIRLTALRNSDSLKGCGSCVSCGRGVEFHFNFAHSDLPKIMDRLSFRSVAMPLVFSEGLNLSCFVGGLGGIEYLNEAKYIAQRMNTAFPPIVVWRPRETYQGLGQLAARLVFHNVSGSCDLSLLATTRSELEAKVQKVKERVAGLELQKKEISSKAMAKNGRTIERLVTISAEQNEIRRTSNFSVACRDLKLLSNVEAVRDLQPCLIDYAINLGLESTSQQWVKFLVNVGDLVRDIELETKFNESITSDIDTQLVGKGNGREN